jgi:hypothetical protein
LETVAVKGRRAGVVGAGSEGATLMVTLLLFVADDEPPPPFRRER